MIADAVDAVSIETSTYTIQFAEVYRGTAPYRRKMLGRAMIVQLALISGIVMWGQWYSGGWFLRTNYGRGIIAFAAIALFIAPLRVRGIMKKVYTGRFGTEPTVARFDLEGIRFRTPTIDSLVRWNGFTHYVLLKELIIVYRTARIPFVIPRRAFADEATFKAAGRWVDQQLGYQTEHRGFEVASPAPAATR